MLATFLRQAAIAALLIAIFVSTSPNFARLLSLVVCLTALIVCGEAFRSKEHGWASLFLLVALIFSTLFLAQLPPGYAFVLNFLCLGLFISSVVHSRELLTCQVATKLLRVRRLFELERLHLTFLANGCAVGVSNWAHTFIEMREALVIRFARPLGVGLPILDAAGRNSPARGYVH